MFSPMEVAQRSHFGGIFDSIKAGLAQVVPAHTIVGKWAAGDTAGAAAAAGNLAIKELTPKARSAGAGGPIGLQPTSEPAMADNTMLYIGLGAAALIGIFFLRRK